MTIAELKARLADLHETAKAIQAQADAEKRDLTDDESTRIEAIFTEFDSVEADIKRRERMEAQSTRLNEPGPRPTAPTAPTTVPDPEPAPQAGNRQRGSDGLQHTTLRPQHERQRWGWQNFGDFALAVLQASRGQHVDDRLRNAALSTYGSEDIGADGGFSVPPEWRGQIMTMVNGEDSLLSRTDMQPISGNSIVFPVDETTPWQSTGGIQTYWGKEAAAQTQSKVALQPLSLRLDKLTCLVPVTDELLEDAPAMATYVPSKAGQKLNFKVNDAIINGDGAGMPLGLVNAPCKVTVSKESSQAADTLVAQNILKMYARMPAANRSRAVWLLNQDVEPQLLNLNITFRDLVGSAGIAAGAAAYLPPGGLSGSPYATLMGRPILPTEACGTIGDLGDIIFTDLGAYLTAIKSGGNGMGIKSDVSIHLWFDQGATAFRFTMRMAGRPWLSAPISRKSGSNTLSTVVVLEAR